MHKWELGAQWFPWAWKMLMGGSAYCWSAGRLCLGRESGSAAESSGKTV